MSERDRIVSVTVENFKIITEACINDIGDIVEIKGDTGQGKTSIIEAIEAAISGIDPSLIRYGADKSSITVKMTRSQFTRSQTGYGPGKGTLTVTELPSGRNIARGQEFLDAIFPTGSVFDPLEFALMGGGDAKGKTERLRRQRSMLLEAIPHTIDEAFVADSVKALGSHVVEAIKGTASWKGVNYGTHSLGVVEELLKITTDSRKLINAAKDEAVAILGANPEPHDPPKEPLAVIVAGIERMSTEKREAETQQRLRGASIERRDKLKADIAAAREGLESVEAVTEKRDAAKAAIEAVDKKIAATETKMRALQEELDALKSSRATHSRAVSEANAAEDARAGTATLEKTLAELEQSIGADQAATIEDLGINIAAAEEAKVKRQKMDNYIASRDKADAAKARAAAFDEVVKLFRDTIPKRIVEWMKMPVEGLGIEEGVVCMNGIPLHQLGTSEQIKVGVMLATALNPKTGFICIDRAESLGKSDRLALRDAAKEAGVQLILTTVDPDAVAGPGVVIMEGGHVKT